MLDYKGCGMSVMEMSHRSSVFQEIIETAEADIRDLMPKGNREKFDPYKDITERQHRIALEAAFTLKDEYGYQELAEALQEAYASVGATLGGNKVVKLITVLKSKRMIVQENGRKYTFNPDFHY